MKNRGKSLLIALITFLIFVVSVSAGASRITIPQVILAVLSASVSIYLFINSVFSKNATKKYDRKLLTTWSALDAELDPTDEMNRG